MTTRLQHVHQDVLKLADPADPSRWTKFWRKVGKTAYAVWDHKKAAAAAWTVGVAASIGVGIATGGMSLLLQFAIGVGVALAKKTGGSLADYASYKMNKKKLKNLDHANPDKIGRSELRTIKDNLDYNEEHLKTALFKATHAFIQLSKWKRQADLVKGAESAYEADITSTTAFGNIPDLTPEQAQKLLADMYNFYFEYDRALHYFSQYEVFVEFSMAYVAAQGEWYNSNVDGWDRKIRETTNKSHKWHTDNCRKSTRPFKTDVCYGAKKQTDALVDGATSGDPYHRVTE